MAKDIVDQLIDVLFFTSLIGTIAGLVSTAVLNLSGAAAVVVGLITVIITLGFMKGMTKTSGIKGR